MSEVRGVGIRAGTGYADAPDSREAGQQAAREATAQAGGGSFDFAICFHHGRHNAAAVLGGVRAELGPEVPIVGGTAMGVITNTALGYEGHQVGVAVLSLGGTRPALATATGIVDRGEDAVGRELGTAIANWDQAPPDLLLFYSSIRRGLAAPEGMALSFGTPLVRALLEEAGEVRTAAGAGLIDSLQPSGSHVFDGQKADPQGAVAVGFGAQYRVDSTVLHGCRPAGTYRRITKTNGPAVLEIDERPALQVMDDLLGGEIPRQDYPFRVILGVNRGEKFGEFREDDYQTRLCLAIDEDADALIMFEPDLQPGDEVQLMRVTTNLDYVKDRTRELLDGLGDNEPILAIYADCAGRAMMASPLESEEGDVVREAIGDIPLLGFYTGVEIGEVRGEVRPLDWTGVLCVLSR